MKLIGTMKNEGGILSIGGISIKELANKYETPLIIYDLEHLENTVKNIKEGFSSKLFKSEIVYASKAYLSLGICEIIEKENLHIDAVSAGELFTIKSSKINMKRVHMHGNNKSDEELNMCFDYKIGSIILDNYDEVLKVISLSEKKDEKMDVSLRLNIGIDAHTHDYIKTSKHTSKFGISMYNPIIKEIVEKISKCKNLTFKGFHCHIGSQISDVEAFLEAVEIMVGFTKKISQELNIYIPEINLGGGFGIKYTDEDKAVDLKSILKSIIEKLEKEIIDKKLNIEKVSIEPGRSLICESGSTLYSIGGIKDTFGKRKYIFVDGGMTDNIRPALYQAKYDILLGTNLNCREKEIVTVAGKCCESGDLVSKDISLEKCKIGDLLLVKCTGAYTYSMGSNYNKALKPAVIFIKDGKSFLATKRENYNDLIKNDNYIGDFFK